MVGRMPCSDVDKIIVFSKDICLFSHAHSVQSIFFKLQLITVSVTPDTFINAGDFIDVPCGKSA